MNNNIRHVITINKHNTGIDRADFYLVATLNEIERNKIIGDIYFSSYINKDEFIPFAIGNGFEFATGNPPEYKQYIDILHIYDVDKFYLLLVYSAVSNFIHNKITRMWFQDFLKMLPTSEIRYWANTFSRWFRNIIKEMEIKDAYGLKNINLEYFLKQPATAFMWVYEI